LARVFAQIVGGPIVDSHADDRAAQQATPFEAVERAQGHLAREIAADPEDHEDVCGLMGRRRLWHLDLLGVRTARRHHAAHASGFAVKIEMRGRSALRLHV
jgi:hypothetical protein